MQEIVDKIKAKPGLHLGSKADVRKILDCKKYIEEEGIAPLPDDYSLFIKYINGLVSDVVRIYGIMPDTKIGLSDIAAKNEELNRVDKSKVLVLGHNVFDWLVYDWEQKEYQARDLGDGFIIEHFSNLENALKYFLGIDVI